MNLVLKSCKSDAQSMTVVVVNADTGVEVSSYISSRTSGGPFMQHDASVKQLLEDLFVMLNKANTPPVVELAAVVEAPAETEPALVPLRRSAAPKGAA